MDSIKVSANTSPTPLVTQLLKNGKLHLVCPLFPAPACDLSTSPTSPPSSLTSPSGSSDKTDNHDTFGFYPDLRDMEREEERLKSFDNWPLSFLSREVLAKNGFYYLGRGDEVRCAFCKVEIMRWMETDDPASEHKRWAPECPFLRRNANSGNASPDSPAAAGRDECGARALAPPNHEKVVMPGPVHPRYGSESARLRTFNDWPRSMPQKPKDLAEAGFFYTGQGDKTKCFYCDGGLKDWETDDDPWEQHARWFDRCAYVQLVKGKEYVQKVLAKSGALPKAEPNNPTVELVTETKTDDKSDVTPEEDAKLCKICYVEERNVCFVPCGHVVACAKCALSTNKCPMCRRTFQNAVRLYFS